MTIISLYLKTTYKGFKIIEYKEDYDYVAYFPNSKKVFVARMSLKGIKEEIDSLLNYMEL